MDRQPLTPATGVLLLLLLFAPAVEAARADASEGVVRLGFVTDAQEEGERPLLRTALWRLRQAGAEAVLYGGDTNYAHRGAPDDWVEALDAFRAPGRLVAVLGNHDAPRRFDRFLPGDDEATWWSWSRGHVHVLGLDTNAPLRDGSPQRAWLERELARLDGEVVVLLMHVSWWAPLAHDPELAFPGSAAEMDALVERHGVDLVLAGHEHYYARTQRGSATYLLGAAVEAHARAVPPSMRAGAEVAGNWTGATFLAFSPCRVDARSFDAKGREMDRFSAPLTSEACGDGPVDAPTPGERTRPSPQRPSSPRAPPQESEGGRETPPLAVAAPVALAAAALALRRRG